MLTKKLYDKRHNIHVFDIIDRDPKYNRDQHVYLDFIGDKLKKYLRNCYIVSRVSRAPTGELLLMNFTYSLICFDIWKSRHFIIIYQLFILERIAQFKTPLFFKNYMDIHIMN